MTVAVNDRTTGPLEMTGGETVIAYDWKILSSADLAVWRSRAGTITQLALTTDYTVSGVGSGSGGDVTLVSAALADDVFVVEGLRPSARTSDLVYDKAMPPATLNGEYDSLQIQVQELRRDMDRAIKLSRFETTAPGSDLPEAVAGKALGFNDDGDLDLIDAGGGGGGGSMTGAEIVTAIDTELGGTTWQGGGGGGGGATDLGYTASPTQGVVTSNTGTDATLPLADSTNAGLMAPAQHTKLAGIESGATADQTSAEIETAYNTQVAAVSQVEAEAGTEAAVRRWSPLRVAQAIAALAGASGDPVSGRTLKFRRNLTGWQTTSSTSADLTLGSKSMTVGTGKSFEAGDVLKCHQTANSSNYALSVVTAYNSGTGALVHTFMAIVGSGTGITGWTINAAAEYRKPADLAYIEAWAIGGGGAGDTAGPTYGGAGGGSYATKAAADLSAGETVTVGAGGASGNNGGDTTAFGMTASGGHCTGVSPFDANGGAASGGLINIAGEDGVTGGAVPAFGFATKGHPGNGFGVGGGPTTVPGLDGVVIVREHFGSAGSGGGGGATNLSYTASATDGTVASDTGTDATLPLADGTNAGLMAPAQHTKLGHIAVTQAVDLDAIETRVNALDAAVILKGSWDASAGTFPGSGTAQAGDSWIVSVAGTVDSVAFAVGDRIIAITDNASTSTFASNWFKSDYTDAVSSVAGRTGAVTLAVADIVAAATAKLYGRKSASGGPGEEMSISEALDLIGSTAQGDIVYRGASGWARLAAGTAGHFLKTGGTGANPSWDAAAGGGSSDGEFRSIQVFTSSGTYTKPSGLVRAEVWVVGGGGGGGAFSTGNSRGAPGGGAGGLAYELIAAASIGGTETVTIGAAGAGNSDAAGSNGGTSSFGALCSATGGTGGGSTQTDGGAGGSGSGGTINMTGGQGGSAVVVAASTSGKGGDAPMGLGTGGASKAVISATGGADGLAGVGYGAGGSGSARGSTAAACSGGAGTAGIVIVKEYF